MKNKRRLRICEDCGRNEMVFNKTEGRCRECANKLLAIERKERSIQHRIEYSKPCEFCKENFYSSEKSARFCSQKCVYDSKRIKRICKECEKQFVTQIGRISGKGNSRANFCGIECYRMWQCRTKKSENRRYDWVLTSREVIRKQPFCSFCGTTKKLNCHHIIPYRLTRDDSRGNLMVLCKRCHSKVECMTRDIEKYFIGEYDVLLLLLRSSMLEKLMITASIISKLMREINEKRSIKNEKRKR